MEKLIVQYFNTDIKQNVICAMKQADLDFFHKCGLRKDAIVICKAAKTGQTVIADNGHKMIVYKGDTGQYYGVFHDGSCRILGKNFAS